MKLVKLFLLFCIANLASGENLVELAARLGANTLVKLLKDADLTDVLATGGIFTVFAPTDAAFAKLPKDFLARLEKDKQLLAGILVYHVVKGNLYSSQLTNEQLATSLLFVSGHMAEIRMNIYNGGKLTTADGSPIVLADQNATNGVIHVVDRVLYPIPSWNMPQQIYLTPQLKTLLALVQKTALETVLSGSEPFTLFAPTHEAFAKLPTDVLNKLRNNVTALTAVLEYHVVRGTQFSAGLTDGEMAPTMMGQSVTIAINGSDVMVNNATVEMADVAVTNGVIHVIDGVLLPQDTGLQHVSGL